MKNFQSLFFFLPLFVICLSCKTTPSVVGDSFGAGVSKPSESVAFADVMQKLEVNDSVKVVMKAKVGEVCQAKGCWMNLVDPVATSDDALFVKFKDYAFFVPKDISGREVLVEGVAYKEETTVDELRHYAEDAGKSAEEIAKITEPVSEKKFMATGVVLLK
ncbi:MAG TPA: DUF4920 domain-containing protein [Saprospiraceae bacterium]|nr:DUF4920 domain-containing protein [Saprospiraceae bacterium]